MREEYIAQLGHSLNTNIQPDPIEHTHMRSSLFEEIAQRIRDDIYPETTLVVGCGSGLLVKHLRAVGLQAWGIEDPQMLNQQFIAESSPYCSQSPLTTPLSQSYALITCLECVHDYTMLEAEAIIANLCNHTTQIIFSVNPFLEGTRLRSLQEGEVTLSRRYTPDYWVELFSRHNFYRDLGFKLHLLIPWAMKLTRRNLSKAEIAGYYERWLQYEQQEKERHMVEKAQAYLENDQMFREKDNLYQEHIALLNSNSWRFMKFIHQIRYRFVPLGSTRELWMHKILSRFRQQGEKGALPQFSTQALNSSERQNFRPSASSSGVPGQPIKIEPIAPLPEIQHHTASVDIIVCIHNALPDVKKCLDAVLKNTSSPYTIILVDDGSNPETRDFLVEFSQHNNTALIRNEQPLGYTRAANQGFRCSNADFALLLNSDTIVTPEWLDRLVACAESAPKIGIVGPLSNTASWQSIPEFESEGDWAVNPLPSNLSIAEMARLVAVNSGRLYPAMPFINGFCIMIRKKLIEQIGIFDEDNFGDGYGEENDFCLRARNAGWHLALADDVYIYHAQSKSYSDEKRKRLSERAGNILAQKYDPKIIDEGVRYCRENRVLKGIRARSRHLHASQEIITKGKEISQGKNLLFVLPVPYAGGGSNVVITEANAMQAMGVNVRIFNLKAYEETFRTSYPDLKLPVIYRDIDDLPGIAAQYDAVIATYNPSVAWLAPARRLKPDLIIGYYVQDYEPLLYPDDPQKALRAKDSYTLIPGMKLFSKTKWTSEQLRINLDENCTVVGLSVNSDLFRPRPRKEPEIANQPLRIGAMIRGDSPYRAPQLTMEVFRRISHRYGPQVEIRLFGMAPMELEKSKLPKDFAWKTAGILTTRQVASYLNELDIFVDFSSHQAMGLTALEAMACGGAVIVPQNGGAVEFAINEHNSLVVDTTSSDHCTQALIKLVEEPALRSKLQDKAINDVCQYYPESAAYRILNVLFG